MKRTKTKNIQMSFSSYFVEKHCAKGSRFYDDVNTIINWNRVEKVINKYYSKGFDKILQAFNKELESRGIVVNKGVKLDASLTDTPRKPKRSINYEIAEDREEDQVSASEQDKQSISLKKQEDQGVDTQARGVKKGGKYHFGFKHHDFVNEDGLVLAVHTTTANEHDSKGLKPILKKLPNKYKKKGVWADKGYKSQSNDQALEKHGAKNRIIHKSYRNRSLSQWQKRFNRLISKSRWVVERTFGSIKKWFRGHIARYVGMEKTHTQHILQAIAYNLKRAPGLIVSNSLK